MKLKMLFIIPVFMGLFGSCAVSKYDYYYHALKTDNSELKVSVTNNSKIYSNTFSEKEKRYHSNQFHINLEYRNIDICIQNSDPIYIDYSHSLIKINDIEYKLSPLIDSIMLIKPVFSAGNHPEWQDLGTFSFPDLQPVFERYNDTLFDKKIIKYKKYGNLELEKEIPIIEFDKENSPLKIAVSVSYCNNEKCNERRIFHADFYLSTLMKNKDKRENELRTAYKPYTFYVTAYKGKTWGWPEIRKGLGWTTTILCLPVTLIIDLVPVVFQGKETGTVPFPLFE